MCISCPNIEVNRHAFLMVFELTASNIAESLLGEVDGGDWTQQWLGEEVELVEGYDLGLGPLLRPRSSPRQLIMLGYSTHSSVQRIQTHWQYYQLVSDHRNANFC